MVRIGTAAWNVPRASQAAFPEQGAHLERYAQVLPCCEIDSTFRHRHRESTYRRWAASTPAAFRFSVKLPERVTHTLRLAGADDDVAAFLDEIAPLGERLGPLLVQLPASAPLERDTAEAFFSMLRRRVAGAVVCEPRHAGWFTAEADALLRGLGIGRVGADPARHAGAQDASPADDRGQPLRYFRWHGAPDVYRSSYGAAALEAFAVQARAAAGDGDVWCIFDNTAAGHAAENALALRRLLPSGLVDG